MRLDSAADQPDSHSMLVVDNPEAPAASEDTAQWHCRLYRKVQARSERGSRWRATQIPFHYHLLVMPKAFWQHQGTAI